MSIIMSANLIKKFCYYSIIACLTGGCILGFCCGTGNTIVSPGPLYKGRNIHEWISILESGSTKDRLESLDAFVRIGRGIRLQSMMRACIKNLNSDNYVLRWYCAGKLAEFGPEAKEAIPELLPLLKDRKAIVRQATAFSLESIGDSNKPVIIALRESLEDPNPAVRVDVAKAYATLSRDGILAMSVLLKCLKDSNTKTKIQSLRAIGEVAVYSKSRGLERHVFPLLENRNSELRQAAIECVGDLGPLVEPAFGQVFEMLRDKDAAIRAGALSALQRIKKNDKRVITALVERLENDKSYVVRYQALCELRKSKLKRKIVISGLIKALNDPEIQVEAADTLAMTRSIEAVPILIKARNSPDWFYRQHIAQALGAIGLRSSAVKRALLQMQTDREESVRQAASNALQRLGF